ncbi:MAG: hypothetical protein Q9227_007851 [Pyrenula ochraceoflavens]
MGTVLEVYGPPGVGKTALAMQLTAAALKSGHHVVWLDTGPPLVLERLQQFLSPDASLANFTHIRLNSLAHALALLIHAHPSFPPPNTRLIILDSISPLVSTAFPLPIPGDPGHSQSLAANRRFPILKSLSTGLSRLASAHGLAVLVVNQCGTTIREIEGLSRKRAVLRPAVQSTGWDEGVDARVCLFRDFVTDTNGRRAGRFARIVRREKRAIRAREGTKAEFEIWDGGIKEIIHPKHEDSSSDEYGDPLDGDWEALVAAEDAFQTDPT